MLSVKQEGIKYYFDWTPVSWTIGEHSNNYANGLVNLR